MDLVRRNRQFPIAHPRSPFSRSIVPSRTSDRIVFGGGRTEVAENVIGETELKATHAD